MQTHIKTHRGLSGIAAVLLAVAPLAHAATYTFNGTTTGNTTWSSGTNWDAVPVSASNTALIFGTGQVLASAVDITTTQNIVSPFELNSLTISYNGSGTEPLVRIQTGNLTFVSDGLTTPTIALNSTGATPPQLVFMSAVNFGNDIAIGGASSVRFEGAITNTGGAVVTKSGGGTLRIASDNAGYTGNFNVTGGIFQIGNNGNVGDAGNGTVTLSTGGQFIVRRNGGNLTLNNTITGTGNVRFQNRGNTVATINKANDYIGTTLLEASAAGVIGGIKLGIDNGLSTTTAFSITNSGASVQTFDLNGFAQSLGSLATTANGSITNSIITNTGAAKTLTISNSSGSTTYAGRISGNISLSKAGASTQVLTGNNTFTGSTTVSAGTLVLSGGGSINGSSLISVSTGATLTNNSTVAVTKALALEEGSLLAGTGSFAGSSLTVTGNLAGGSFDSINIGATFTKPGSLNLTLSNVTDGNYALFSGTAPGGSFASVSVGGSPLTDQGGGIFSANIGGVDYSFTDASNLLVVAVPEPGTWILVGIGLTFMLYRKRRRFES